MKGFFYATSMSHRKTPHFLCGALRVCRQHGGFAIFRSEELRARSEEQKARKHGERRV